MSASRWRDIFGLSASRTSLSGQTASQTFVSSYSAGSWLLSTHVVAAPVEGIDYASPPMDRPLVPQRLGISTTMAAQEPERTAEAVRRSLPQAKLDPELPCGATKRSGK